MKEHDVLSFDPFQGDFGTPDDKTLKDKIVTARKRGECHLCGLDIIPGTRVRSRTDIFDGQMMYFRWCHECCKAMESSWNDNGVALEKREHMREK